SVLALGQRIGQHVATSRRCEVRRRRAETVIPKKFHPCTAHPTARSHAELAQLRGAAPAIRANLEAACCPRCSPSEHRQPGGRASTVVREQPWSWLSEWRRDLIPVEGKATHHFPGGVLSPCKPHYASR